MMSQKNKLTIIQGIIAISALIFIGYVWSHANSSEIDSGLLPVNGELDHTTSTDGGQELLSQDLIQSLNDANEEDIDKLLLESFQKNQLQIAATWDIPETENKLILAAPSLHGPNDERIICHFEAHAYCGLYIETSTSSKLLIRGERLTGFTNIERFPDVNHAIIATSFSFYNYVEIARHQLDLTTGELVPVLIFELDTADDFSELQISGSGSYLSLLIEGSPYRTSILPASIVLRDMDDVQLDVISPQTVQEITTEIKQTEEPAQPIFIQPTEQDIEDQSVHIDMYGRPYVIDLSTKRFVKEDVN